MASLLAEARSTAPELIPSFKAIESIGAYKYDYADIFRDLIDWYIFQLSLPQFEEDPLLKYPEEERKLFMDIYQNITAETRLRTSLHTGYSTPQWYDPFGKIYEIISSQQKSQALGQFFTPPSLCDAMAQMTLMDNRKAFIRILDCASGSGRTTLSFSTHAMSQGVGVFATNIDIDSICAKMSAVNQALNGHVGESLCDNGLSMDGSQYRFGYRVLPFMAFVPEEKREVLVMKSILTTGINPSKQYVLQKISYEESEMKKHNDVVLEELKNAHSEKKKEEIRNAVKERMKGTQALFGIDEVEAKLPESSSQPKKPKKKSGGDGTDQGSLF